MNKHSTAQRPSYPLDNNFTYHPPHGDQPVRYVQIRDAGRALAEVILTLAPTSREQSLALTKVEEAIFWTNAAIARNEHPQAPGTEVPSGSGQPR